MTGLMVRFQRVWPHDGYYPQAGRQATIVEKRIHGTEIRATRCLVVSKHKRHVTCLIDNEEVEIPRRGWNLIAAAPGDMMSYVVPQINH